MCSSYKRSFRVRIEGLPSVKWLWLSRSSSHFSSSFGLFSIRLRTCRVRLGARRVQYLTSRQWPYRLHELEQFNLADACQLKVITDDDKVFQALHLPLQLLKTIFCGFQFMVINDLLIYCAAAAPSATSAASSSAAASASSACWRSNVGENVTNLHTDYKDKG